MGRGHFILHNADMGELKTLYSWHKLDLIQFRHSPLSERKSKRTIPSVMHPVPLTMHPKDLAYDEAGRGVSKTAIRLLPFRILAAHQCMQSECDAHLITQKAPNPIQHGV
jgi:hypothetical protein